MAEVDGGVLVAVPGRAWSRRVKGRALPKSALARATPVDVSAVTADERGTPLDAVGLRVWLGVLEPQLEAAVIFESDQTPTISFGSDGVGVALYPHAETLAAAAHEAFAFHSAESAAPGIGARPSTPPALEAAL